MEFNKCKLCGKEKTLRQFSIRVKDICRSCVMGHIKTNPIQSAYSPISFPKINSKNPSKKKELSKKIEIVKPTISMGYQEVVHKKPTVNSYSLEFNNLSQEERREILKTEYRLKRMNKSSN